MEKTKVTCSFGNDEYGLQTGTVKISDLHDFKGHPFKVEQDIQLFELMRSIEDKGVLVPLIVRSNPYGDGLLFLMSVISELIGNYIVRAVVGHEHYLHLHKVILFNL